MNLESLLEVEIINHPPLIGNDIMKTTIKIITTIGYVYVLIATLIQGDPWRVIGFFFLGVLFSVSLLILWGKNISVEVN